MEISYKRELNHNYLIIENEKNVDVNGYEIKMIINNQLPCFLMISIRYVDSKLAIYYEISSKQSMERIYENKELGYEVLRNFLFHFHNILLTAEEYLIESNHLIIDPEYIYMDIETNEIALVYYPGHEEDAKAAFQKLAEYILNRVNHQDERAVFLAYKMYKSTRNNNFILEEILKLSQVEDMRLVEIEENMEPKQIPVEESSSIFKSISDSYKETVLTEENKNEKREDSSLESVGTILKKDMKKKANNSMETTCNRKFYYISIVFAFILGMLLYLKFSNLLPESISYDQFLIMLGAATMISTGCILKIYLDIKRSKLRQEEENEYEEMENEKLEKIDSKNDVFKDENVKQNIEKEKTDTIQIYDFVSSKKSDWNYNEEVMDMVAEETSMYGNTVLLGSVCNEPEKFLLQGKIKGKEIIYQLDHFPFTVGKLAECVDLELRDISISRMHARFFKREGSVYLEDMNSTNGTFKNGMRLEANETVKVEVEDEISFAKLAFVYH